MRRLIAVSLFVVLLAFGAGIAAQSTVSISIEGSFETPSDTVTVDGEEFTVTQVTKLRPDDVMTVVTSAPRDKRYQVNVYTLTEDVQASDRGETGPGKTSFRTEFIDPGSYLVAAVDRDGVLDVQPITVVGYETNVDLPSTVDEDTPFEATVQLEEIDNTKSVGRVEVVIWNDDGRERIEANQLGEHTYEATVDGLANETYDVYAVVVAEEQIEGEDNVIGLSDPQNLTVREVVATPTPTPTPTGITTPTETPTDDGTGGDDETPTTTPTESDPTPTPTITPTETTPASTDTATESGGDDLLTPVEKTETASDDGNGFGVLAALVAIAGAVLYRR
jgi:hypothetical protein